MDPFYLALILYITALGLAFVDLFIPSGGVLLIMSGLAAIACVLFGFRSGTGTGMAMLTIVLLSIPGFVLLAIKIWPLTPIGKRVILPAASTSTTEEADPDARLIGQVVALDSPLMPSGMLRIEGKSRNAVARNGVIDAGQNVEIVGSNNFNLVVIPTDRAPTLSSQLTSPKSQEDDTANTEVATDLLDVPAEDLGLDSLDS